MSYFSDSQSGQENLTFQPVEPPPPISLEELQGEARTVASKVLSRPQSGMVFMEDIRTAIAMWADRLTNLLGPPRQGTYMYNNVLPHYVCVVSKYHINQYKLSSPGSRRGKQEKLISFLKPKELKISM